MMKQIMIKSAIDQKQYFYFKINLVRITTISETLKIWVVVKLLDERKRPWYFRIKV